MRVLENKYLLDLYKQAQTPHIRHEDAFKLAKNWCKFI